MARRPAKRVAAAALPTRQHNMGWSTFNSSSNAYAGEIAPALPSRSRKLVRRSKADNTWSASLYVAHNCNDQKHPFIQHDHPPECKKKQMVICWLTKVYSLQRWAYVHPKSHSTAYLTSCQTDRQGSPAVWQMGPPKGLLWGHYSTNDKDAACCCWKSYIAPKRRELMSRTIAQTFLVMPTHPAASQGPAAPMVAVQWAGSS